MRAGPELRGLLLALAGLGASARASAAPAASAGDPEADAPAPRGAETRLPLGTEYRLFTGAAIGRGVRFNNPYRLGTELGNDAQSLSLTATYADVSLGAAVALGESWLHGAVVHGSFALDGVPQEVVTPSYLLVRRLDPRFEVRGRAGVPVVVEPDLNAGFEAAVGGTMRVTAALGLTADLVGSLFYGAGTLESSRTTIPIVSLELGLTYEYEVLP